MTAGPPVVGEGGGASTIVRRPRRSYSASTAAMTAIDRARSRSATNVGSTRSRNAVEIRPARKSSCATIWASTGIVVRMPTTLYSESARAMRWIAVGRSAPHTISLASKVS